VTGDHISVELAEAPVAKGDFDKHLDSSRHELDKIWATMRDENTAIRREITDAVQHSQEMLMASLKKTGANYQTSSTTFPARS